MAPAPTRFPVAGDVIAFTLHDGELQVLLVERKYEPFQGRLAFPGGFVEPGEDLGEAALRELREETGLRSQPEVWVQLGAYGVAGRDPRGETVGVAFIAISPSFGEVTAGDDAAEAAWHPVRQVVAPETLAFDHNRVLGDALRRATRELGEPSGAGAALNPDFAEAMLEALSIAFGSARLVE